jgi:hypothetical protein
MSGHLHSGFVKRSARPHVDKHIDMAVALLLKDAVGRADEVRSSLEQVDLLQRQVRLEERVLQRR